MNYPTCVIIGFFRGEKLARSMQCMAGMNATHTEAAMEDKIAEGMAIKSTLVDILKTKGAVPYNTPTLIKGVEVLAECDEKPIGSARTKGRTHWTVAGDYLGCYENGDVEMVAGVIAMEIVFGD